MKVESYGIVYRLAVDLLTLLLRIIHYLLEYPSQFVRSLANLPQFRSQVSLY